MAAQCVKTPCDDCRKYGRCGYTPTIMKRCFYALGHGKLNEVICDFQVLNYQAQLAA